MSRQEYPNAVEVSVIFHEGMKMFAVPKQPAQRTWVGLTDDDEHEIELKAGVTKDDNGYIVSQMFRLIEAKLKEKNT